MGKVVVVTLSEYRSIMQWDEDGGTNTDTTYEIVPELSDDANSKKDKSDDSDHLCGENSQHS